MSDRVLFVRSDVKLAGPGRLMLSSARALRDAGVDVTFATGGGAMVEQIEEAGFDHHTIDELRLDARSVPGSIRAAMRLAGLCRKHGIGVVHAFNAHAALCAMPGAKIHGAKVFNTVLGNGKENLLRRLPLRLIAVSNSVKDKLVACGIPAGRIDVVYNSTLDARFLLSDDAAFQTLAEERAARRPLTFVSVAICTGQKGHAEVIEAVRYYKENGFQPDIRVKFVGDGPRLDEMKSKVASHGMSEMFDFVGASSEVETHLDQSHVFIHLAEMETFGMVLAEAGGRGLPSIASDVGGIPEVVLDGRTGVLVDRNDAAKVAETMGELAGSPELRNTMGRAAAARSRNCFTQEQMAKDLMRLYGTTPTADASKGKEDHG